MEHFLGPFEGNFKGKAYDSNVHPTVIINNSAACASFSLFVSDTIIRWVTARVIAVWGPVDGVQYRSEISEPSNALAMR